MPKDLQDVSSLEELEELLRSPESSEEDTEDTPSTEVEDNEERSETDNTQEGYQPSEEEILSYLQNLPPERIISAHPGVAGKVGALAQTQATKLAAAQLEEQRRKERELADQAEEEELVRLAEENPEAAARGLAERVVRKRKQNTNVDLEENIRKEYGTALDSEMNAIYETPIMQEFANQMTDEQLAKLWWKNGRYNSFAAWAQDMLSTVREFAKEEAKKELAGSAQRVSSSQPEAQRRPVTARRTPEDFPVNLGDQEEARTGSYVKGDVDKMPFGKYAANREAILKDIFGDE